MANKKAVKKKVDGKRPAARKEVGRAATSSKRRPRRSTSAPAKKKTAGKRATRAKSKSPSAKNLANHLIAERKVLVDRLAQIDALLETYAVPPEERAGRSKKPGTTASTALEWLKGVLEEGGHKWEELVKRFEESSPGQKLASLETAVRQRYLKRIGKDKITIKRSRRRQ